MYRKQILEKATQITMGNREEDYGSPEDNFQRIATMWSAYTGADIDAKDVAAMMAIVKIARIGTGHGKSDNWVDLAGYAACGGEIESNSIPTVEHLYMDTSLGEIQFTATVDDPEKLESVFRG